MATLTHGRAQRPATLRRRARRSSTGSASPTCEAIEDGRRRPRHRLRLGTDGRAARGRRAVAGRWTAARRPSSFARDGYDAVFLDGEALRDEIKSPIYLGGFWDRDGCAMVDPARLAWGLRRVCLEAGVRLAEGTPVLDLERDGKRVRLRTPAASVSAARVALGTNAFPSLLKRLRLSVIPIYDYALMTEPLDAERRAAIGWRQRQGLGDAGNQFHYYRLTHDDRILWGGYDAVYYYGSRIDAALESRPDIFAKLAGHFFTTFPQLEGVRFTHAWGGVVDTCLRLCVVLRHGARRQGRLLAGLHGHGRGRVSFRGGDDARAPRRRRPDDRVCATCAPDRCPSRPSRCATPPSRARAARTTARTRAVSVAPGSVCSTASASASTPDAAARPVRLDSRREHTTLRCRRPSTTAPSSRSPATSSAAPCGSRASGVASSRPRRTRPETAPATPSAGARRATPSCSARPATSTSTSPTGCTSAPTSSARAREWGPRSSCGRSSPLDGLERMAERRGPVVRRRDGAVDPRLLCGGPARLTQALAIGRAQNGLPAWREPLVVLPRPGSVASR